MNVVDGNADTTESEFVSVSVMKAVPIVLMNGETPQLDLDQLERIFEEYKDHLVAVISVFGVQRGGKSFLLNLLCHYLMENQSSDWFKRKHSKLVNVFHWRGGTKADTSGIYITDKPFILKNDHGQKVAVFLMDTQGSFDKGMTAADSSFIAALSSSLSSVQVYNLQGGLINESDLQHLQIFLNHARAIIETEHGGETDHTSQFQCLLFLVRNFQSDYESGSKGGMEYLKEVMKADQDENKYVRKKIKENFADIRCHLLEHPGKNVTKLKDSDLDKIKVSDIDEDFLEEVDDLAKCLFSKHNLVVKQLNGKACTCKDLMKVAKHIKERVESGETPKVNSLLKDNEIVEFHRKMIKIEKNYEKSMKSKMGGKYTESKMLEQLHEDCLKDALKKYDKLKHDMLDEGQRSRYRTQVEQYLKTPYKALKHKNEARRKREIIFILDEAKAAGNVYLTKMIKIADEKYLEDVNSAKAEAETEAIKVFKISTSDCNLGLVREFENKLYEAIELKHGEFERRNAKHLRLLDKDLDLLNGEVAKIYVNIMDQNFESKYVEDDELYQVNERAKQLALEAYHEFKREVALSAFDVYEQYERKIKQDFEETFNKVKENNENNKMDIERKLSAFYEDLASDYIMTMNKASRTANKMTMNMMHERFKESVIEEVKKAVPYKNIQENAIVACEEKMKQLHNYLIEAMVAIELTGVTAGALIGASAGLPFGPAGIAIGTAVGTVVGTATMVAKNLTTYWNFNISELPSIIYLKSLNL